MPNSQALLTTEKLLTNKPSHMTETVGDNALAQETHRRCGLYIRMRCVRGGIALAQEAQTPESLIDGRYRGQPPQWKGSKGDSFSSQSDTQLAVSQALTGDNPHAFG